jgi:ABC-type transport system substrate-binding protein
VSGVGPSAAQERVLRMAVPEGEVLSLDPHGFCCRGYQQIYFPGGDAQVLLNIFDGLVQYDPQTLQPVAALAESWDISDDGLVYTFHLREARFHDGSGFTAHDVVNSFNRLANPPAGIIPGPTYAAPLIVGSIAGYADIQVGYEESLRGLAQSLTGLRVVDDRTVEITLSVPNSAFLSTLTMPPAAIIPLEKAVNPTAFSGNPVGTGPFMVEEWAPQDHVTLVRNPNYWGEAPALDRVILRMIPDKSAMMAEFLAGNLDIALVPPSDIVRIRADSAFQGRVQEQSILSVFWLIPNLTRPPLDNLQVRQALAIAIDRQAIVASVLQGQGVPAHGPLPPGLPAYDPNYNPFPFDPNRARELLAQAGFPNGVDVEFRTWTDELEGRVLTEIQAQWAAVGIRATFHQTDYPSYSNDMAQCNMLIGVQSWAGDYADPNNFIMPLATDASPTAAACGFGQIPEVKELALQALRLPPGTERDGVYRQAERAIVENVLGIYVYHRGATLVVGENVQGAFLDSYNNVLLDPISLPG